MRNGFEDRVGTRASSAAMAARHDARVLRGLLARMLSVRAHHGFVGWFEAVAGFISKGDEQFAELGVLNDRALFIHGTGLDRSELRVIAEHGASLSIAPAIEMVMGHGLPPVAAALDSALAPSLSVDVETTTASDMFTQLRAAYQVGRYAGFTMNTGGDLVTTRQILRMATIDGARALHLDDRTGSLTPGKSADLVLLRTDRPGVAPVHDPVGAVVLSMDRADVELVMVGGRIVKRAGELVRRDVRDLIARADAVHRRVAVD